MAEHDGIPHDTLNLIAAQYVLGVLSASARERVKARMLQEKDLRDMVHAWERRLNPLAGMVAPEPVPPHLWQAIMAKIEQADTLQDSGFKAQPLSEALLRTDSPPARTDIRYRRWKTWAGFSSSIAAALALFIMFDPNGIVPLVHLPPQQTTPLPIQDIAVLSNSEKNPAWIVRSQQGQLLLINLNAASVPAQHDLELWRIEAGQAPRSLGVLKLNHGQAVLSNTHQHLLLRDTVLAISLEPKGGSPTGTPTGTVLYSGSIVRNPA